MLRLILKYLIVACVLALTFGRAQANTLIGDTILGHYECPFSCSDNGWNPGHLFTVVDGVDALYMDDLGGTFHIDFSANALTLMFTQPGQNQFPGFFYGPVFQVNSGNPFDPILSVSSNGDALNQGFDASRVSEQSGLLQIDLRGLYIGLGEITVTFASDNLPPPSPNPPHGR
jgi:hypothetical protein